ncbi:thioredoxin domain-containing protein [Nocardioides sp. AN3]
MSKRTAAAERAERAAAALAEQRHRERRRTVLSVVGVVAAMALIVVGGFAISKMNGGGPSGKAADPGSGTSMTIGDASAPHSVVVYEDFLCPYCGEFEKQTHQQLASLAEQGKVSVTYRPFRLLQPDYSQQALEVWVATQHTAGDAVAKRLHDLLYAHQPSESASSFPSRSDLVTLAVEAGADKAKVQAALDSGDATTWADASTKSAGDAGVRSTPTVLLDGKEFVGRTIDDMARSLLASVSS